MLNFSLGLCFSFSMKWKSQLPIGTLNKTVACRLGFSDYNFEFKSDAIVEQK